MRNIENKYKLLPVYSCLVATLLIINGCDIVSDKVPKNSATGPSVPCERYVFDLTTHAAIDGELLEIRCDSNEVVFGASADHIGIISPTTIDFEQDALTPGDIDGDGIPDLIIAESNGNCCVDYTFITLGSEIRSVSIENIGGQVELVDLDKDGKFEIKALDTTFVDQSWANRFDEPAPTIILEAKNGRFELGIRFMKVRSADLTTSSVKARSRLRLLESFPFSEKVSFVERVYRGQGEEGLNYLDAVYNGTRFQAEKDEMVNEAISALLSSPYWEQVAVMNKWQYEQPDGELACPEFAGREWLISRTE